MLGPLFLVILFLFIGIVCFCKDRIRVTPRRELRGQWLNVVATLFCLPIPLVFLVALGVHAAERWGIAVPRHAGLSDLTTVWLPIGLGLLLAFLCSRERTEVPDDTPSARGFEVRLRDDQQH